MVMRNLVARPPSPSCRRRHGQSGMVTSSNGGGGRLQCGHMCDPSNSSHRHPASSLFFLNPSSS
jgi:hypothetical protein